ncbi:MAG: M23 family metallopeptidase [Firmicutes bacterium]|nr:M23 family metallopeptidase [Bacillota bacterium]
MNEQPRKNSGVSGGRLLKLAWVRVIGWGSTISNVLHYAVGGLRRWLGAWWHASGQKVVTRGLVRLAALVIIGVMALGVVNYIYRMYSFRQSFEEPYEEHEFSLDMDSELHYTLDESKREEQVQAGGELSGRLVLGSPVTELFPIDAAAPEPDIEAIAISMGSQDEIPARVDAGVSRTPVNPINMLWPAQGQVTVGYGWVRHPIYRDWRFHPGIELSTSANASVSAVMDGRVQQIQSERVQGLAVILNHGDGWETIYRGLSQLRVREGDMVKRGQVIGTVGPSENSQNGRLLFEIRQGNTPLEPRMYLP